MNVLLSFTKIQKKQNALFDEFFLEATRIDFISFNYDSEGAALCRCDGVLRKIEKDRVNKILFGVKKGRLDGFLKGIFDPDYHSEDLTVVSGNPTFRLVELNELSKYPVANLAKKIHKELQTDKTEQFIYYEELVEDDVTPEEESGKKTAAITAAGLFHGNEKSHVFHDSTCTYYSDKNCTAKFVSREDAIVAGFKPCKLCQ
ncbi:hypothetical protein ACFL6N_07540 [Thermodesulfobacteriota bacterium]